MSGFKKWLLAFSLLASFGQADSLSAQHASETTPNTRACHEALLRSGLPTTGRMVIHWSTRNDLQTELVSRSWNYFLRVSACSRSELSQCINVASSSYAPGNEILDGHLNLFLRIPVRDLGCVLARKHDVRGIGIILAESGYIYNEYSLLQLVDFDRLREGAFDFEVPTSGRFRIYFE